MKALSCCFHVELGTGGLLGSYGRFGEAPLALFGKESPLISKRRPRTPDCEAM